jgi:hypothetical protein
MKPSLPISTRFGHTFTFNQPSAEARQALDAVVNPRVRAMNEWPVEIGLSMDQPTPGDIQATVTTTHLQAATAKLVDWARMFAVPFRFDPDPLKTSDQLVNELQESLRPWVEDRKQLFSPSKGQSAVDAAADAMRITFNKTYFLIEGNQNTLLQRWKPYILDKAASEANSLWVQKGGSQMTYQGYSVIWLD